MKCFVPIAVLLLFPLPSGFSENEGSTESPGKIAEEKKEKTEKPKSVTKDGEILIDGVEIPYTVTATKTILETDVGEEKASIFHVSYIRKNIQDTSERPVMFAFNGGPGSSSVWLHLGILGPKRIVFEGDGTVPMTPPARLMENEFSILDECDLVFIDPVSTGFSRAEGESKAGDFHGVDADIASVGEFIRVWITENKRWGSPKYLCGESYGGVRAAGLGQFLQDEYGMNLNGVVLLSALLDYRTIIPAQGSVLSYQAFLSSFATTALHHGKIVGNADEITAAANEFAFGEYALALLKGSEISDDEAAEVAEKLSSFTGISAEIWVRENLRMSPFEFRAELLRDEGKVIGRFDSRVAWDASDVTSENARFDPSYSLAIGAFSTAMLTYLGDDLGWVDKQHYKILTSVSPWDYGSGNQIVNVTGRLERALRDNPKLKILVMGGYTDLATPPEGVAYSLRQAVGISDASRKNITYTAYDAGHMFYMNLPDLEKSRKDLLDFIKQD